MRVQVCGGERRPSADRVLELNRVRRGILGACRLLPREELEAAWLHLAAQFSSHAEQSATRQQLHESPGAAGSAAAV